VAAAVAAKRLDFDACFQESLRGEPDLRIGRRTLDLKLSVIPEGIVTQIEIDDPVIQNAALGTCVRGVVRGLVFPIFQGEPVQMRVPLTLGGE